MLDAFQCTVAGLLCVADLFRPIRCYNLVYKKNPINTSRVC